MASGTSYNGWPASDDKASIGVVPFGDAVGLPFPGGVKAGDVATVLGYVAIEFHYRVEPVIEGWDWGHAFKANVNNPSQLSCHASGTALDINAPAHPNGSSHTFTDEQVGEIYAILNEVQGAVDWLEGYDEMHFEICVGANALAEIAAELPALGNGNGDELDMTEDDLRRIVGEVIDSRLDEIGITVWSTTINENGAANALLNQAAVNAQWAVQGIADVPTNVWVKTITDETANVLLARAANG